MDMSAEKSCTGNTLAPQYCMITRSEPQYELIRKLLLEPAGSPAGRSYFFLRGDPEAGCVCRIKDGNGAVLFYEILDHKHEGITDQEIREAMARPTGPSGLPGYYYITPEIEQKLRSVPAAEHAQCGVACRQKSST